MSSIDVSSTHRGPVQRHDHILRGLNAYSYGPYCSTNAGDRGK